MEFLKRKWGCVLLVIAVVAAIAVTWYLLFWTGSDGSYTDGLLVQAIQGIKGMTGL